MYKQTLTICLTVLSTDDTGVLFNQLSNAIQSVYYTIINKLHASTPFFNVQLLNFRENRKQSKNLGTAPHIVVSTFVRNAQSTK